MLRDMPLFFKPVFWDSRRMCEKCDLPAIKRWLVVYHKVSPFLMTVKCSLAYWYNYFDITRIFLLVLQIPFFFNINLHPERFIFFFFPTLLSFPSLLERVFSIQQTLIDNKYASVVKMTRTPNVHDLYSQVSPQSANFDSCNDVYL